MVLVPLNAPVAMVRTIVLQGFIALAAVFAASAGVRVENVQWTCLVAPKAAAARAKLQASRRFRADPPAASLSEWERFVEELQSSTDGVGRGDDCFLVLRLDGRLRASGKGMPDWERLIEDVPKSTELVSKLES